MSLVLLIFWALVTAVYCGPEPECANIDYTNNEGNGNNLRIALKNGSTVDMLFTVGVKMGGNYQLDFTSTSSQVVVRLQFRVPDGEATDVVNAQFSSLRNQGMSGTQTVGRIQRSDIIMSKEGRWIRLKMLVTDELFEFEFANVRNDDVSMEEVTSHPPMDEPSKVIRSHNMAYQTTHLLFYSVTDLSTVVCNTPDVCNGVCLSCPGGTYLDYTNYNPRASFSENTTNSCEECSRGTYSQTTNVRQCQLCPKGHYAAQPGSNSCTPCSNGYYTDEMGSERCSECTIGHYTDKTYGATLCLPCQHGTYSEKPTTSCTKCPQGTITIHRGSTSCVQCPGSAMNDTHCTCKSGTYRVDANSCSTCKSGTFTPRDNMDTCLHCAGIVDNNTCTCPEGHVLEEDHCVWIPCKPGYKRLESGMCVHCPAGSFSTVSDSIVCTECSPGYFQDKERQNHCDPCPMGSAQYQSGSKICPTCHTGTYQDNSGQAVCKYCHGTVLNNGCHKDVFECPGGTVTYPNIGTLVWESMVDGKTSHVSCMYGGVAERSCVWSTWLEPDLTRCNSGITHEIERLERDIANEDNKAAAGRIADVIQTKIRLFGPKDIDTVTTLLDSIPIVNEEVAEGILRSTLDMTRYEMSLQHVIQPGTKSRLVSLLEQSVDYLVTAGGLEDMSQFDNDNIKIRINRHGKPYQYKEQQIELNQNVTHSTLIYRNSKLFTSDKTSDMVSSDIYGIQLHGAEPDKEFAVGMQFKVGVTGTAECRWFDTDKMKWSINGCYVSRKSADTLYCSCDHLTSFAVFTSLSEVPHSHRSAQSTLTTLLFVISIVTLLITLAIYIPIRSLRSKVVVRVEMMEISALILANITFLVLARIQHQTQYCVGLVFAVQYFYLVTMAWSFVATWTFYGRIVNAINTYGKSYKNSFVVSCLLCWVLPVIFPAFALLYSQTHDLPYVADIDGEFGCWIDKTWKTYTFIIPILVVVFINTVLGIKVIMVMMRAGSKKIDSWDAHKRHIKSIISLLTIFGTSFLLSLFTYGPHAIVFQYLFICFTCSQGLIIFICFVPLRPEVHNEWKLFLNSRSSISSPKLSRTETSVLPRGFNIRRISSKILGPHIAEGGSTLEGEKCVLHAKDSAGSSS